MQQYDCFVRHSTQLGDNCILSLLQKLIWPNGCLERSKFEICQILKTFKISFSSDKVGPEEWSDMIV